MPLLTPTSLHVGCGTLIKQHATRGFLSWNEIRLDIDPAASPDVIGSTTDMAAVATSSVQAVFPSHNIEHLVLHKVPLALAECLRVLDAQGDALITCTSRRSVSVASMARAAPAFHLWALASKPARSEQGMTALMRGRQDVGELLGFSSKA